MSRWPARAFTSESAVDDPQVRRRFGLRTLIQLLHEPHLYDPFSSMGPRDSPGTLKVAQMARAAFLLPIEKTARRIAALSAKIYRASFPPRHYHDPFAIRRYPLRIPHLDPAFARTSLTHHPPLVCDGNAGICPFKDLAGSGACTRSSVPRLAALARVGSRARSCVSRSGPASCEEVSHHRSA